MRRWTWVLIGGLVFGGGVMIGRNSAPVHIANPEAYRFGNYVTAKHFNAIARSHRCDIEVQDGDAMGPAYRALKACLRSHLEE